MLVWQSGSRQRNAPGHLPAALSQHPAGAPKTHMRNGRSCPAAPEPACETGCFVPPGVHRQTLHTRSLQRASKCGKQPRAHASSRRTTAWETARGIRKIELVSGLSRQPGARGTGSVKRPGVFLPRRLPPAAYGRDRGCGTTHKFDFPYREPRFPCSDRALARPRTRGQPCVVTGSTEKARASLTRPAPTELHEKRLDCRGAFAFVVPHEHPFESVRLDFGHCQQTAPSSNQGVGIFCTSDAETPFTTPFSRISSVWGNVVDTPSSTAWS